jgi:hypothetical protein
MNSLAESPERHLHPLAPLLKALIKGLHGSSGSGGGSGRDSGSGSYLAAVSVAILGTL